MANLWVRIFLPRFFESVEISGLVDIDSEALSAQGDFLNLPSRCRFRTIEKAFNAVDDGSIHPTAVVVVIPPAHHREAVEAASQYKLDVLTEKPLANSWEDCVHIYNAVKRSRVKLQVVQNYRFKSSIQALKRVLTSGVLGHKNALFIRFNADYREVDSWGAFRHQIPHSLLVEAGIHHLDQARHLCDSDISWIACDDWRPDFAKNSFRGECCSILIARMASGTRLMYEGTCVTAGQEHSWDSEMYRFECERGTIQLNGDLWIERSTSREIIPIPEVPFEGHFWIIREFLDWITEGKDPSTPLEDNIKSNAAVFAAIEASETNSIVHVGDYLRDLPAVSSSGDAKL